MSSQEEAADVGRVLAFLREWDRGDNTVRSRILKTFLTQSSEKTFYQLECEFAQISSLFLARLTTWMRLTYPFCSAFIATVFLKKNANINAPTVGKICIKLKKTQLLSL